MLFRHNGTQRWSTPFPKQNALEKGMEEKSREFVEKGSELYAKPFA